MAMIEYPKCLLRDGSAIEWDGKPYDVLIVEDAAAEKAARADGWQPGDEIAAPAKRKGK